MKKKNYKIKLCIILSMLSMLVIFVLFKLTFNTFKLQDVFQSIHKHNGEMHANYYMESPTDWGTSDWLRRRKAALKSAEHKKLLLFCHMRGGSTFFGDLFRQNSQAMYWYEPIAALYMALYGQKKWQFPLDLFYHQQSRGGDFTLRSPLPDWEVSAIAEFNHHLLGCDFNHLPAELFLHPASPIKKCINRKRKKVVKIETGYCNITTLSKKVSSICKRTITVAIKKDCGNQIRRAHKFVNDGNFNNEHDILDLFLNYSKCRNYNMKNVVKPCFPSLANKCSESKLVVYKGLRLMMESVDAMLQMTPDMHVIYFMRDPRSIVTSRISRQKNMTFSGSLNNPLLEAKYLCKKMLNDYQIYKQLDKKYPGAIKFVRYEDLVNNRYSTVEDVYRYLDIEIHQSVHEWIEDNLNNTKNGGRQSTRRANSTASLDKWQRVNSVEVQQGMTRNCEQLLTTLGYEV